MNETDLIYLAGLLDGEGCFSLCRGNPQVVVRMTHEPTMRWLGEVTGTAVYDIPPKQPQHRPAYQVVVTGGHAAALCRELLPHLRIKRPQAEEIAAYVPGVRGKAMPPGEFDRRMAREGRLRELNRTGPR